jgi:hypothetical protein
MRVTEVQLGATMGRVKPTVSAMCAARSPMPLQCQELDVLVLVAHREQVDQGESGGQAEVGQSQ